jgi:hypothetical protein
VCLNAVLYDTEEGGTHPGSFPGSGHLSDRRPEGDGCMFGYLEASHGYAGSVSGFVSSSWATFMFKVFRSGLRFKFY